jgi:hypothetical protein
MDRAWIYGTVRRPTHAVYPGYDDQTPITHIWYCVACQWRVPPERAVIDLTREKSPGWLYPFGNTKGDML